MRRRAPLVALAVSAALLAGACGSSAPPAATRATLPPTPTALPTFDLARFQSLLASLRGTPVVVNVWASWCGPCIAEAPGLAATSRALRGRVQFLGIDVQDQRPAARAFITRYGWSYPSVFDPTGAIRSGLGFVGQPVTVVYDAAGTRRLVWSGAVRTEVLRRGLASLLS
jgi:thiol-disulfide isomerase/thioredoxin